jgi:hypothetical protein
VSRMSVVGELTLDGGDWDKKLNSAEKGVEHLAEEGLGGLKTAIAEAFSLGALVEATKVALEFGEEISNGARRLGVTTDEVQRLGFAARQAGSDLSVVETAMDRLARSKEIALGGGVEGAKIEKQFAALGISIEDLRDKEPDELFRKIGESLEDTTTKAATTKAMMDVFGRGAGQLIPVLKELREKSALAPMISKDDIETLHGMKQAWDALQDSAKAKIATGLARVGGGNAGTDIIAALTQFGHEAATGTLLDVDGSARGASLDKQLEILNQAKKLKAELDAMRTGTEVGPHEMTAKEEKEQRKEIDQLNADTAKKLTKNEDSHLTTSEKINKNLADQAELKKLIAGGKGGELTQADYRNQLATLQSAIPKLGEERRKELFPDKVREFHGRQGDALIHTGNFLGTSSNSIVAIGEKTNAILAQIYNVLAGGHYNAGGGLKNSPGVPHNA